MIIQRTLNNLADWKDFIKSENIVEDLVNLILEQCDISVNNVKKIDLGTNAVFDLGNYILKIYAVNENSNSKSDCIREIILSKLLISSHYHVPTIIKTGYIDDRYNIYYNVMEKFNDLVPVCNILANPNSLNYMEFLKKLHLLIKCINSLQVNLNIVNLYSKSIMGELSRNNEYVQYVNRYLTNNHFKFGIVHGDLSETNIYYNNKGEIIILDFEDWMYAPFIVEYPTICFELLKTPYIIHDYFANIPKSDLIEMLTAGILLHHESTRFLKLIASKTGNTMGLLGIKELRLFLSDWLL